MRIFSISLLVSVFSLNILYSQILDPVEWQVSGSMISMDEAVLMFRARIDDGWYVYSQYLESDDGPVRTSIVYDDETKFSKIGSSTESGGRKEGYDEMFDMNVIKYANTLIIEQRIKITDAPLSISGYIEYMSCDDTRCLPPGEETFRISLQPYNQGSNDKDQGVLQEPSASTEVEDYVDINSNEGEKNEVTVSSSAFEMDDDLAVDIGEGSDISDDIEQPAAWNAYFESNDLVFEVKIDDGWKIYSSDQPIEDYSVQPVAVDEEGVSLYILEDAVHREVYHDVNFDERLAIVKQGAKYRIPLAELGHETGELTVNYMACDAEKCIFPEPVTFSYDKINETITIGSADGSLGTIASANTEESAPLLSSLYGIPKPLQDDMDDSCVIRSEVSTINSQSFFDIFLLGLLGGLIAILTPCVFPMIPLTVSYFTKRNEKMGDHKANAGVKQALSYAFFIFLIYLLLSIPFHLMDTVNPDILNNISTNVVMNIVIFVVLIVFGLSFMGFFEITLPSSFTNKVSQAENSKGLVGIFFMALTLCIVSFSCTGPILGTLLAGALTSEGGANQLTMGLAGFGIALALPFGLFAAVPKLMNKLPKSGGWMTTMKVTLGFIELALAFKFLSNADMVKQWGLLKYEVFMVVWILCALGLAAYLFNLIRFPHDMPNRKLGWGKIFGGSLALLTAIYLTTGLFRDKDFDSYRSLNLLSGLAPPTGYSYRFPAHCPNGIDCFNDLQEGMSYARAKDKPVMLDFTGYACVNCRKMEEHVWPQKSILNKLKDDYVLVSLYVDDKTELPEEVIVPRVNGEGQRKLRRKGELWQHLQTAYFNNNSQPFYVLLSPDGAVLNEPVGYTPNPKDYEEFLNCGLDALRDRKILESLSATK